MPNSDLPRPIFITLVCAIVLLAANMRAPIAALGSIAPVIQNSLNINQSQIGWLGSVPVMMFALGAFISPKLSKHFSIANLLLGSIILLTVGIVLRVLVVDWWVFLSGTVILSLAIGLANTLAAPAIKLFTPNQISLITGVLSLTMTVVAGIVAGIVLPLNEHYGWQWALGIWGVLSFFAIILWWFAMRLVKSSKEMDTQKGDRTAKDITIDHITNDDISNHTNQTSLDLQTSTSEHVTSNKKNLKDNIAKNINEYPKNITIWKLPLAWHIAVFMGLQSLIYYTFASFLPSILTAKGLSLKTAGQVATIFFSMAPFAIIFLTWWMKKFDHLTTFVAVVYSLVTFFGCFGITYLSIDFAWLWAGLIGFGGSLNFTLAFMLITMRTYTPQQSSELAGMSQTIGYCIAFFGPIGTGWLHEVSDSWQLPLNIFTLLMGISIVFAFFASRNLMIDGKKPPSTQLI